MDPTDTGSARPRYCVIGAGAAGLAAVRALIAAGHDFDCFEATDRVGGHWHTDYDNLHLITPRSGPGSAATRCRRRGPTSPVGRRWSNTSRAMRTGTTCGRGSRSGRGSSGSAPSARAPSTAGTSRRRMGPRPGTRASSWPTATTRCPPSRTSQARSKARCCTRASTTTQAISKVGGCWSSGRGIRAATSPRNCPRPATTWS